MLSEKKVKDIVDAFSSIETHSLEVNTVICTVCGCIFSVSDKSTKPCVHLKELAVDFGQ